MHRVPGRGTKRGSASRRRGRKALTKGRPRRVKSVAAAPARALRRKKKAAEGRRGRTRRQPATLVQQNSRQGTALQISEEHYRNVYNTAPLAFVIWDRDTRVVDWNKQAEALFGWSRDEVLGRSFFEFLIPQDSRPQVDAIVSQLLRRELPNHSVNENLTKDGKLILCDWNNSLIHDADGEVIGAMSLALDITERTRTEAALREAQRLAGQRERLADIGAIAATIVHDIGNPLAGLSMQAQLLLRRARRDENQPASALLQPAERIAAEVRHLEAWIREFMDFTGDQRLDLKPVDLPRMLGQLLDLWRPVAGAREIALALHVAAGNHSLWADEEKLRRVFDNLVKNAIEAIEQGPGEVHIRVAPLAADKVEICVEDTGPGIPQALDVFRLFETTKPNGSGLGLAIVKQIVHAHGGAIDFTRREPRGTVFRVALCRQPSAVTTD